MPEPVIKVNPDSHGVCLAVGRERTAVIVIDNFATNTADVVRYAREKATFAAEQSSAYPGVRAPLARGQVIGALTGVHELLYRVYEIPSHLRLRPQNAVYSLVTTPPAELKVSQSVPHYDSCRAWYFALTLYLNPGAFGGTALFRHRPTGFENIGGERVAEYVRAGEAFIAANGTPPPGYMVRSDAHYEIYEEIDYRPNRLLIYPGSLLHSGLVDPARDLGADPATGRLTANIFIDFQ